MEQEPRINYSNFSEEIRSMYEKDQEARMKALENEGILDEPDDELDLRNTERIKDIIKQIGWPTISKVGESVSNMAWLLVQHADHDIQFQKDCLRIIKQLPTSEVSQKNIAYLEDRVAVNEKQPQIYGTQFYEHDGIFEPRPIKDPERVDDRRDEMGMEPLEEYAKFMKEKYDIK